MAAKVYFYKDGDVTKKYVYCSRCSAGPFKPEEESITQEAKDGKFVKIDTHMHMCLCIVCAREMNMFKMSIRPPVREITGLVVKSSGYQEDCRTARAQEKLQEKQFDDEQLEQLKAIETPFDDNQNPSM